jgi:hypothetical protein
VGGWQRSGRHVTAREVYRAFLRRVSRRRHATPSVVASPGGVCSIHMAFAYVVCSFTGSCVILDGVPLTHSVFCPPFWQFPTAVKYWKELMELELMAGE